MAKKKANAPELLITVVVNNEWLKRDIAALVATGMTPAKAAQSLPVGKYLNVTATQTSPDSVTTSTSKPEPPLQ